MVITTYKLLRKIQDATSLSERKIFWSYFSIESPGQRRKNSQSIFKTTSRQVFVKLGCRKCARGWILERTEEVIWILGERQPQLHSANLQGAAFGSGDLETHGNDRSVILYIEGPSCMQASLQRWPPCQSPG